MNRYQKGANFEREIVAKFWGHEWASMRAAGSGTTSFPVPDVIGIRDGKIILIECKATRKEKLSLKKAVLELKKFSNISKADAFIAVKFHKQKPRFFNIDDMISKGQYTISKKDSYLSLEAILGEQKTLD